MRTLLFACLVMLAAHAVGCGATLVADPTVDETSSGPVDSGFPCDVRAVLESNCAPCHAGTTYLHPLTTRDVWLSTRLDGTSFGQYAAMQVAAAKMPPATAPNQPTADERAILIDWVAAGMPPGPCTPLTPPSER